MMTCPEHDYKLLVVLMKLQYININTPTGKNSYAIDNFPGYCLNCKNGVVAHAATRIIMLNGKSARQGTCPECNNKIYQIQSHTVSSDEYHEYRASEIKEVVKQLRAAYNELVKQKEWLDDPLTQAILKWTHFFEE